MEQSLVHEFMALHAVVIQSDGLHAKQKLSLYSQQLVPNDVRVEIFSHWEHLIRAC